MRKKLFLIFMVLTMVGLLFGCSGNMLPSGEHADYDEGKISGEVVDGNSRFAFDIFKQLDKEDGTENIFISPLSISTALTMTYQGADTTTKEDMAQVLGYAGIEDGELNESYQNLIRYLGQVDQKVELNMGNSLWVREGESIKEDFLATNKEFFDASVTSLDFSKKNAADQINQWISDATKEKIKKMIEPPIAPDVVMYLINAIYFKGDWTEQFDKKLTSLTQFYLEDGSESEVMMMSKHGKVEYGQGDNYQIVRLPYGAGKIAMYCILPQEDLSINKFIEELDLEEWQEIKENIREIDEFNLKLPRFKMEYGIKELNDSLTALGMGRAFADTADFSRIRNDVYISGVFHKAVIEVNEEGSEAAAATVVEVKETISMDPLEFIADRPFVFMIQDDETGTILFMGKVKQVD